MDRLSWTSPGSSNFSVPHRLASTQLPSITERFDGNPHDRYDPAQSCTGLIYDRKTVRSVTAGDPQADQQQPLDLDSGKFGDASVQGKDLVASTLKYARRNHGYTLPLMPNLSLRSMLGSATAVNLNNTFSGAHKFLGLFSVLAGSQDLGIGMTDVFAGRGEGVLKMATGSVGLGQGAANAMSLTKAAPVIKSLGKKGLSAAAKVGLTTGAKVGLKLGLGRMPVIGGGLSIMDGMYDVISSGRKILGGTATGEDRLKAACGVAKMVGGGLAVAGCFLPPLGIALVAAGTAISIGADLVANHKPIKEALGAGAQMAGKAAQATGNFLASVPSRIGDKLSEAARGLNPMPGVYERLGHGVY